MCLWLLAYLLMGQVGAPLVLALLGLGKEDLGTLGLAVLHLGLDLSELVMTLMVLARCLKGFDLKKLGLFTVDWDASRWLPAVLLGCFTFPVVDYIAQQSMVWFPLEQEAVWTNSLEQTMSVGDWISNSVFFMVVSVCAPIWEEVIFRGFLLVSLTKYLPQAQAIFSSAVLFAMLHFRLHTFLPLLLLGIIFAILYLKTRNLLPPIFLHSLWNIYVLVNYVIIRPGVGLGI